MRKGRPLAPLLLAVGDRAQLVAWSKRPKTAQALAMRSRIVLLAADGLSNTAIASQLHTMQHTVGKWRRRYLESGLDGLVDEPRPGTSNKLSDQDVERVLALTLESTPADATHWSTRSMAKRAGLSRASIHRIWRAFSLAPHRSETFKLSKDPLFIDKVRDIVASIWPRRSAPWCCVWTRRARYKHWTAAHRYCPCVPVRSNAAPTITPAMAPPACSPPWKPKPAR
jgi:transposase